MRLVYQLACRYTPGLVMDRLVGLGLGSLNQGIVTSVSVPVLYQDLLQNDLSPAMHSGPCWHQSLDVTI